jgi:DNA processing protein
MHSGRHGTASPAALAPSEPPGGVPTELEERLACGVVASAPIGSAAVARLVDALGSGRAVLDLAASDGGRRELLAILGPDRADAAAAVVAVAATSAERAADLLRSDVSILLATDPDYPPALLATRDPPPVLFVRGDPAVLSVPQALAIVGTRRPTEAGRRTAGRIASAVASLDAVVVSGLAIGIDGAAHAAAVAAGARTIAVLGGGHERLYPRAHRRLASEIVADGGAVLSEAAPWVDPTRWSFPQRNRIISGLSRATIVVEAGIGSGALITAHHALEQGRAVFVVPGPLDAGPSAGCLALLREAPGAARVVAGIPELLVDLELVSGRQRRRSRARAALAEAGPVERELGNLIAAGTGTVDALVAATDLPVATVLAAITLLETRGLVVDVLGRYRPAGALVAAPARASRRRAGEARSPPLPW